jgi:hypothetical protein
MVRSHCSRSARVGTRQSVGTRRRGRRSWAATCQEHAMASCWELVALDGACRVATGR